MKIGFTASSGGHLEQLMMLYPMMRESEAFVLTEKTKYKAATKEIKDYQVLQLNRNEWLFLPKLMIVFIHSLIIFLKERPDVMIGTGALATFPVLMLAKLFGKKVVFIESFSKMDTPTITGKLVYRFADLFIVQWRSMKKVYPGAVYGGGIY